MTKFYCEKEFEWLLPKLLWAILEADLTTKAEIVEYIKNSF